MSRDTLGYPILWEGGAISISSAEAKDKTECPTMMAYPLQQKFIWPQMLVEPKLWNPGLDAL